MKFKFTAERVAAVCSITEYFCVLAGQRQVVMNILPRFVADDKDQYIMDVEYNEDGSIKGYLKFSDALNEMRKIPVKELEHIVTEIAKACGDIVNPPNGEDLKQPSPSE